MLYLCKQPWRLSPKEEGMGMTGWWGLGWLVRGGKVQQRLNTFFVCIAQQKSTRSRSSLSAHMWARLPTDKEFRRAKAWMVPGHIQLKRRAGEHLNLPMLLISRQVQPHAQRVWNKVETNLKHFEMFQIDSNCVKLKPFEIQTIPGGREAGPNRYFAEFGLTFAITQT